MLKEKDINWLKISQGRSFRVTIVVFILGMVLLFAYGYWNIRMAFRLEAERNFDFVVASYRDIDMDAEYSGAHFIAQKMFYTGLTGVLWGIILIVGLCLVFAVKQRNQRILKFIEEHRPEEVRQLLRKDDQEQ